MASKEPFLLVPTTEDEAEQQFLARPNERSTLAGSLSVEIGGVGGDDENDIDSLATAEHEHLVCCGCCCDFRRAVLVINGMSIVLKILEMLGMVIFASFVSHHLDEVEAEMDDDEVAKMSDAFVKSGMLTVFEVVIEIYEAIAIGLYACGIYGALNFKRWGIITAMVTHLFQGVIMMSFVNILITLLCLYPHLYMLHLMKAGIMTEQNYHRIEYCRWTASGVTRWRDV